MLRTAVVTGGTKGIGKAIVKDLLLKGYLVVVNYANSDEDAKNFTEELSEYQEKVILMKADLSTIKGLDLFVENINKDISTIDVLVLNVGITKREKLEEITFESWNKVVDTNLNLPLFTVQKLSNKLNRDGRIIFTGSVLGIRADGMSIQYGVSKAGVHMLTKYLAKHFAERNITVNCIAPGFVDTSWQLSKTKEHRRRIENKTVLKRFAKPEQISSTCMFLIENDYITGEIIVVDGGYTL